MDKRLGNMVYVHQNYVPTLWDAQLHGADNPFLNLLSSIDLVFIFQVVLSLLALLFAYDAVAGECEGGTMRLMMANPVGRSLATAAWAGTDLREIEHFMTQVQQYRRTLIAYFHGKDAFSSRQWFALTTLLLLALMIVNVISHLGKYAEQVREYRKNVSESLDLMRSRTDTFHNLILDGPGRLDKNPSPLAFCAQGGEEFMSGYVKGRSRVYSYSWQHEGVQSRAPAIWRLAYPQSNASLRNTSPPFATIDWVFLIAVVLSFVAILFTFDSISGERDRIR